MAVAEPKDWSRFGYCWTCHAPPGEACCNPRNQLIGRYPHPHRPRAALSDYKRIPEPELRVGDIWAPKRGAYRQQRLIEFTWHWVRFEHLITGRRTRVKRSRIAAHYQRETS